MFRQPKTPLWVIPRSGGHRNHKVNSNKVSFSSPHNKKLVQERFAASQLAVNLLRAIPVIALFPIMGKVDYYEEKNFPIGLPDPVEAIKFRMEQQSLTDEDMVVYLGQRSRVSEILGYKRKLSLNMIRNLTNKLHIPVESLISDYKLHI